MFDTNVTGLSICSREAIKIMKETECAEGHVININRCSTYNNNVQNIRNNYADRGNITKISCDLKIRVYKTKFKISIDTIFALIILETV